MLRSFISTMSKHHLTLRDDSLINVINTIQPGTWRSRCVRPEFSLALAGTKKGKGPAGSRAAPPRKQQAQEERLPALLAGIQSAVTHEPSQPRSLAAVSSAASMRNILPEEGDRVFSVEISKCNGGNLFYNHVTRSQTVMSVSSHQKQVVTPSCCAIEKKQPC